MDPLAELGVLRAARQAIEEGLISTQDYDVVKVAFLRAQQIKAGLDAGFIRQEDYVMARDAYLNALDLRVMAVQPSTGGPQMPLRATASYDAAPAAAPLSRPMSNGGAAQVAPGAASPAPAAARSRGPSGAGSLVAAPSAGGGANAAGGGFSVNSSARTSGSGANLRSLDGSGGGAPGSGDGGRGRVAGAAAEQNGVPTDVPQYAAKGSTNGKCSMAGIGLSEECVNLFMHMKQRSAYKWIVFRVDDSGKTVIPDRVGGKGSSYEEFISTLPATECRYGVYDYEYVSPERGSFSKLVFVNWAPDNAGIKLKMMYAATKDFFKGFLDGIGAELQASEPSEVSEEEIRARVNANITRK